MEDATRDTNTSLTVPLKFFFGPFPNSDAIDCWVMLSNLFDGVRSAVVN